MPELCIQPHEAAVHEEAMRRIVNACRRAQDARGVFSWALSGGSTPRKTYERLRGAPIDWQRVEVFWSDERPVPATSRHSNQRLAREALLDVVPIPAQRVHPMDGSATDLDAAARAYELEMRSVLGQPPQVDLALLGLGEDAHTASLFPGTPALDETERWVVVNPAPVMAPRLTWTPPALRAARNLLVLVVGASKRQALRLALHAPHDPHAIPIHSVLHDHPNAVVLADRHAARDCVE